MQELNFTNIPFVKIDPFEKKNIFKCLRPPLYLNIIAAFTMIIQL